MQSHTIIKNTYKNFNLNKREIDLILCHVLNINTAGLYIYEKEITPDQQDRIYELCHKRIDDMPFAYITGLKDFWKLNLKVNEHTLIPRPETELLVELVLDKTDKNFTGEILDLGTGTGAIALSIAMERPEAKISALDFSAECIKVAQFNKDKYKLNNVCLFQSHWFEKIDTKKYDIIVSNPPYINEKNSHLAALKHEPITALTAKQNGYSDLFHIIDNARLHLNKNGLLMLEHGYDQHQIVQQYLQEKRYKNVKTHKDLSGIPRITIAEF